MIILWFNTKCDYHLQWMNVCGRCQRQERIEHIFPTWDGSPFLKNKVVMNDLTWNKQEVKHWRLHFTVVYLGVFFIQSKERAILWWCNLRIEVHLHAQANENRPCDLSHQVFFAMMSFLQNHKIALPILRIKSPWVYYFLLRWIPVS